MQREGVKEVGANVLETEIFPKHENSGSGVVISGIEG